MLSGGHHHYDVSSYSSRSQYPTYCAFRLYGHCHGFHMPSRDLGNGGRRFHRVSSPFCFIHDTFFLLPNGRIANRDGASSGTFIRKVGCDTRRLETAFPVFPIVDPAANHRELARTSISS